MVKEKTGCGFCAIQGHTWGTPEGTRVCFNCMRSQRNEFHDLCQRQTEEIRTLEEAVAHLKAQIHNPQLCDGNAAGRFVVLKGDLQQLQSTISRILQGLEEEKQ